MNLQWSGLVLGLTTVLNIAAGHILVRRLHARFGTRPALPLFFLSTVLLIASLTARENLFSAVLGIIAITILWDGVEIYHQKSKINNLSTPC
jgi:hypothetical protein